MKTSSKEIYKTYLFCFGGGRESKSKIKMWSFVSSEIINDSTVTETVCPDLNRQKHNSSPISPFFFPLCVTILVMQRLDFLEQVMESGIYSVGLKMAIRVSFKLTCGSPVLLEYVKIIKLFTKTIKFLYSCLNLGLLPTRKYHMDILLLFISSHCNVVLISHGIKKNAK